MSIKKVIGIVLVTAVIFGGCSVYKSLANLGRLQYKLASTNSLTLAGVSLAGKSSINDFSTKDILSFTAAVARGSMPITFTLNVDAKNPNTGSGGYARTNATIESFPYRLMLDGQQVLSGNISSPFVIPGTGETSVIPLSISFDLIQAFKNKSYESLVNLALSVDGVGSGSTKVELYAKPTVGTELGPISVPNEIRIVDTQFSDK